MSETNCVLSYRHTDSLPGILRKLLDALKVDSITSEVLPEILHALRAISLCRTSHLGHRDIVTFITYALHDEKAFQPTMSSAVRSPRNGRLRTTRGSAPEPPSREITANHKRLTQMEIGVSVLKLYAEVLCTGDSNLLLKKFDLQVPTRVRPPSDLKSLR